MPDIFYLQINGLCFIAKTGSWQGNSLCGNCCLTNSSVPERWPPQPPFFVAVAEGYVRSRSDRNPQLREVWRLPLTFGETVVAGAEYNPQARQQQHQQYPWKDAYPDLIQQHATGQCADRNGAVPDHYVQ